MRVLVASDSYKGSLASTDVIQAIREAASRCGDIDVLGIPIADGGEGTLDAVLSSMKGEKIICEVTDPLGRKISAYYGLINETAMIEMAVSSGLTLLTDEERNPLVATSYGLGEMIRHALDQSKIKEIIIGIGGSATNDGGIGMAQALGLRALNAQNKEVPFGGAHLGEIVKLDARNMHPRLQQVSIRVMCDVSNPLCGANGATAIYGPQKGASPDMVQLLEQNLHHLAERIRMDMGTTVLDIPGGGAAGGVGAALVAFCNANLQSGIDVILDLFSFEEKIEDVDLIITGEGNTDAQTAFGKAVIGVARRAQPFRKNVVCLSGAIGKDLEPLYQYGLDCFFSICPGPVRLEESMSNAHSYLVDTAENILRLYIKGRE
ncbi:glycerate kinase family protein [Alicyclobacillus fastidiosus]|uniref:Glycerate kinase n=1 Tax=Alicyclobacillus fastidiosus TaxID=392011 RepID=A0ABV5AJ83_9BACL|nr:glycerate kinase [Alicyclobacillus fastidiosus]WEH09114.1 glycerate kinase [Alicyclobacillus fastidiosus]